MNASATYVVGDVHGHREQVAAVLQAAGLVDARHRWSAGDARVLFAGDLVDRGPDGVGVIDLIMRLQQEAIEEGGRVITVLGNHEILLLAARRFGGYPAGGPGGTFLAGWLANGGQPSDLERLSPAHENWILDLPAMHTESDWLLVHADALLYQRYGRSPDEVNAAFRALLHNSGPSAWDRALDEFTERDAFLGPDGVQQAEGMLHSFGGRQIVHGHTPIARARGCLPAQVREAYQYAGGRCVNVDPGFYLGGPGFVHRLDGPARRGLAC